MDSLEKVSAENESLLVVLRKIEKTGGDHDHHLNNTYVRDSLREGDSALEHSFHTEMTYQESPNNDAFGVSPVKSNPQSNPQSKWNLRTATGSGAGSVRVTKAIKYMR